MSTSTFSYTARDNRTGEKVQSEVEAENERAAAKQLIDRGLAPLTIVAKGQNLNIKGIKERVPAKQRVIFSRQLSTLINAGLPLVQSLNTIHGQIKNPALKNIVATVINDVEGGSALADSLAKHPKVFDDVYISLVAAGEASGTLDNALERLAVQQEKDADIVSKVRGAMVYPGIILVVLGLVLVFMLVTVLPQVRQLYDNLPGAKLPFITTVLLTVSHSIIKFWWLFIIFVIGGIIGFRRWAVTPQGKEALDAMKLRMWPVAPLFQKLYMARFARTSATLAASGVPMIKMLTTTAQAVDNVHISKSISRAVEDVKGGKSLSESLQNDPNFLDLVPNMIHIGEQSGALDDMLAKVADYYEKEVDNQIKAISTIIEPVMMIIVGVLALIIVAAVLLPIYSLAGKDLITH
jgi:type IV pilus assembly protein PilC